MLDVPNEMAASAVFANARLSPARMPAAADDFHPLSPDGSVVMGLNGAMWFEGTLANPAPRVNNY
jgi:hypothetical protein